MSNIIRFPKDSGLPNTVEEAHQRVLEARQLYVDEVLDDVLERLLNDIINYGIRISPEESHQKDIHFVQESIKALLERYMGIEHPMHAIIDESVSLEFILDDGEVKDDKAELTSTEV